MLLFQSNSPKENPIGVFDSGSGGLSVFREIVKKIPRENIVYFSDKKYCPYGLKDGEVVKSLCKRVVDFLLEKNVKAVVIACNTASSVAIKHLRKTYPDTPFVGMEPAIKPAIAQTKTKNILVLATSSTITGKMYHDLKLKYAPSHINIFSAKADSFVEIVEKNKMNTPESAREVQKVIAPYFKENFDVIVFACTHFPFLEKEIQNLVGNGVEIINPAPPVALQTEKVLLEKKRPPSQMPKYEFFTSEKSNFLDWYLSEHKYPPAKIVNLGSNPI